MEKSVDAGVNKVSEMGMKLRPKLRIERRSTGRVVLRVRPKKPRPRRKELWPIIRKRRNPSGRVSYMVDAGLRNGKRPRKFFKTKGEADTHADQLRIARKNEGDGAFSLPQKLRVEALEAQKQLAEVGATLSEAVRFYVKHAAPRGGKKLIKDAVAELLDVKRKAGKRDSYIDTLGFVLNAFAREFEGNYLHEIGRKEIEEWLDSNFKNLATRRNRIRDVSILYSFAVKRGYCAANPLDAIERPIVTPKRPEIFKVQEAKALLTAAHDYPALGMLGFVSIGLFAGLRTSELKQLKWEDVSLEHGVIDVSAEIAKQRQQRNVEINSTLRAWLELCAESTGPVVPDHFRDKRSALIEFSKLTRWPKNGLRHSFGSYHIARFKNPNATALEMGHNTTDMLFKHYRNYQIRPEDAEKYWELRPPANSKIVRLRNAAA
jgi:integrase